MSPDHERLRTALGPFLLGALDQAEATEVDVHLATCADCRAELDELQPAAALLAEARDLAPHAVAGAEAAPPTLGVRVLAAVESERARSGPADPADQASWHRRRRPLAVAAAGGAVAASLVLTGGWLALRPDPAPPVPFEAVPVVVLGPGERTDVEATAGLIPHTWGVEVRLTGSGFQVGESYRVAVLGEDGRTYPAGEFVGTGAAGMVCNLNSSVLRDDAAGFVVRDAEDRVVLRSSFTDPA
ncbi:anti-sigma factor family protein [Nocardioides nanhaiensis]|uniref:Putative zinc-finger domain-containing protein n=1 Tax=Nocardioides nanhaiensis TaxID=1476871 RepID=A0ABP8W2M7_9ACTN